MRGRPNKEEKYHSYISQLEAKEKRDTYRQLFILVLIAAVSISGFLVFKISSDNSYALAQGDYSLKPEPNMKLRKTETSFGSDEGESINFGKPQSDEQKERFEDAFIAGDERSTFEGGSRVRNRASNKKLSSKSKVDSADLSNPQSTQNSDVESFIGQPEDTFAKKPEQQESTSSVSAATTSQDVGNVMLEESAIIDSKSKEEKSSVTTSPSVPTKQPLTKPIPKKKSSTTPIKKNVKPLQIVEKMPQFPGGLSAMNKFIAQRIKYPLAAKDHKVAGKVYLQFVVEPDGKLSEMKVVRGLGYGCDEEALKVARKMPKWIPGEDKGYKVPVIYTLAVQFRIQ